MSRVVLFGAVIAAFPMALLAQPSEPGKKHAPYGSTTVWFFRPPNDDCQTAKFDVDIENGLAKVTIRELGAYTGTSKFNGSYDKEHGLRWTVGGAACTISIRVEAVR